MENATVSSDWIDTPHATTRPFVQRIQATVHSLLFFPRRRNFSPCRTTRVTLCPVFQVAGWFSSSQCPISPRWTAMVLGVPPRLPQTPLLNPCQRLHVFTSVTMQPEPLCGTLSPESILQLPPLLRSRSVHTSFPILVSWTVGRAAKRVPGVPPHEQLHCHVAVRVAIRGTNTIGGGSAIVLPSTGVHTKKLKAIGLHSRFC